ncbi:hypothetical protein [Gemmatimonas sp.]
MQHAAHETAGLAADDQHNVTAPALTRDTAFVVWSHKHGAWWGPNHCGYHSQLAYAGVYTEAEARAIAIDSAYGPEHERSEARRLAHQPFDHFQAMQPMTVTWLLTREEGICRAR